MRRFGLVATLSVLSLFTPLKVLVAQQDPKPGRIEFARDVLPLLRAHCVDCHGPTEAKNAFRLDRRSDALLGGTSVMIAPGNSAASRLYRKLIGTEYGAQMPPDGPLAAAEIETIRRWIDEGAVWPDEFAHERPATIPNPEATSLMTALRNGNRPEFERLLRTHPGAAQGRGRGGATPLMYAALYSDAAAMQQILDVGADVNARNDAGATALMWGVHDLEKVRLLVNRGADVNARSDAGRTPLLIATGRRGAKEVVQTLLTHGADPSVIAPWYGGPVTPLRHAAALGDESVLRMLIEKGANVQATGPLPLIAAVNADAPGCVDLLIQASVPAPLDQSLQFIAPPFGNPATFGNSRTVAALIDRGADVNAVDHAGRTVLMLAASLDTLPVGTVKTLLDRGADVHAMDAQGNTALDFGLRHGSTAVVELLINAGAKLAPKEQSRGDVPQPAASARAALQRSIPLLQRVDTDFLQRTGCISCHHNSLTSLTIAQAQMHGVRVDDVLAKKQVQRVADYIEQWRERVLQDSSIPGDVNTASFTLLGLAAGNHPPDEATDALVLYVLGRQMADGRWPDIGYRPPLAGSPFLDAAISLRVLQVYGFESRHSEFKQAVNRAAQWLERARPRTTEERAYQLLGLRWAPERDGVVRKSAEELLAMQREDGGWSPLPSMNSDASTTGLALFALHKSGVAASAPPYQRGVTFLMNTQLEDGSWHVRSRSLPFQPYFESGFPHGKDQWISAAATNWAALALIPAAQ